MNQLVDAFDLLEIPIDLIGEQRIEHVPEDLARSRRLDRQLPDRNAGRPPGAHADDQQPIGAEMNRWAQRIHLPHGPITEVFLAQAHRREQQRDGDARHQVIQRQRSSTPHALRPCPVLNRILGVVEGDIEPGDIARRTEGQRAQMAALDARSNAAPVHALLDQFPQRRVVEHRLRGATAGSRPSPATAPSEYPNAACAGDRRETPAPP